MKHFNDSVVENLKDHYLNKLSNDLNLATQQGHMIPKTPVALGVMYPCIDSYVNALGDIDLLTGMTVNDHPLVISERENEVFTRLGNSLRKLLEDNGDD